MIQTHFSKKERPYHGPELRPHFLLQEFGLKGPALGAFIGPCEVKTEHLVDWEDRLANDHIRARKMVHFLGEFFGATLTEGVLRQRLFISQLQQILIRQLGHRHDVSIVREGDDLMVHGVGDTVRKLSVSIVTASPVSQLLHVGINIDPEGAPVPAIGLQELGLHPAPFIEAALAQFQKEYESVAWATAKVRPVV